MTKKPPAPKTTDADRLRAFAEASAIKIIIRDGMICAVDRGGPEDPDVIARSGNPA